MLDGLVNRSIGSAIRAVRPLLDKAPAIKQTVKTAAAAARRSRHDMAQVFPALIRPRPRQLTFSLTSNCNLRCIGCLYGRDYKSGTQLADDLVLQALADARVAGVDTARFYGGEPLLHRGLARFIARSHELGIRPYVTTNGTLLKLRGTELFDAGLRSITIGFYGTGSAYDSYTQREGHFRRLAESLEYMRERHGDDVELQLNYVLMKPSCDLDSLHAGLEFADRFGMFVHFDLVSYSLPFFNNDPGLNLQFEESDRSQIEKVVTAILESKSRNPARFTSSTEMIRSLPDWLIRREGMRVPCDAYEMIWIGPDGTVQLCDTTFELGNLNTTPLADILFTRAHGQACRDAFALKCPNCFCRIEGRMKRHGSTLRRYQP
jgi:molybdenum cofactor biosynthesis enzyme MoaA